MLIKDVLMSHFKLLSIILSTLFLGLAGCSNSKMETAAIAENVSDDTATAANPDQALIDRAGAPLFEGMGDHHHGITTSDPGAVADVEKAVAFQDRLPYTEPPFWYYPTRQSLGYALLKNDQATEAEAVYRKDLTDYPRNGWSLFGLSQALDAQGKTTEAATVYGEFETVWQMSEIKLTGLRL